MGHVKDYLRSKISKEIDKALVELKVAGESLVSVPEGPNVYSDSSQRIFAPAEMYQDLEDRLYSSGAREVFRDSGYKHLAALRLRPDFVSATSLSVGNGFGPGGTKCL